MTKTDVEFFKLQCRLQEMIAENNSDNLMKCPPRYLGYAFTYLANDAESLLQMQEAEKAKAQKSA